MLMTTQTPSLNRRPRRSGMRLLLYSHDSYGLGHLRRTMVLARAIVEGDSEASCLILSGSPMASSYRLPERVDLVKLPSVTKGPSGRYTSLRLRQSFADVSLIRAATAEAVGAAFDPHVLVVDKSPAGLRGELLPLLEHLRGRGTTRMVLGLRDIEDSPHVVRREWSGADLRTVIERFYDQIVVYGPKEGLDALSLMGWRDLTVPAMHAGYVVNDIPSAPPPDLPDDYLLATVGGGGDGFAVLDVLADAISERPLDLPLVVVTGPLMDDRAVAVINERFGALGAVVTEFRPDMEAVIAGARAVISRAGYNTSAELVSTGRPALLIPRAEPREEQVIRARRLASRGLALMLHPDELSPATLSSAIADLLALPPRGRPHRDVHNGARRTVDMLLRLGAESEASVSLRPVAVLSL